MIKIYNEEVNYSITWEELKKRLENDYKLLYNNEKLSLFEISSLVQDAYEDYCRDLDKKLIKEGIISYYES